jgi:hypothetical protein
MLLTSCGDSVTYWTIGLNSVIQEGLFIYDLFPATLSQSVTFVFFVCFSDYWNQVHANRCEFKV